MRKRWWLALSVAVILLVILTIRLTGRVVFDFGNPAEPPSQFPGSPGGSDESTGGGDIASSEPNLTDSGVPGGDNATNETNVSCGNGVCEPTLNETELSCPMDCVVLGGPMIPSSPSSETGAEESENLPSQNSPTEQSASEILGGKYYTTCTAEGKLAIIPGEPEDKNYVGPKSSAECLNRQIVSKSPLLSSQGAASTTAGTVRTLIRVLFRL